jgi:phosphoglycolate phosphatase-like HAD superfamily hydrolase
MVDAAMALAPLAVLTNKPVAATRTILDACGLSSAFFEIVGGDGPWERKPDPAGLAHLVAATATTPDRTLMVGDSMVDLSTAQNAGTAICLVRYGFGQLTFDRARLRGDERFADTPGDILDVIRAGRGTGSRRA